jgi:hypothetical protein
MEGIARAVLFFSEREKSCLSVSMVLIPSGGHLQAWGLFFSGGHSLHLRLDKLKAGCSRAGQMVGMGMGKH